MKNVEARAQKRFHDLRQAVFRRTDRLFGWLLLVEWAAAILLALFASPLTWMAAVPAWEHLFLAVFLGGAIVWLPLALVWLRPGHLGTRCLVASAQMMMSGLLIHLTGGRLETHFHIFGSLALLGFYRDWKVFVPATLVVTGDHMLRGLLFPLSVFGILDASPWRWVEHAGWVIFCDIFLIQSSLQSRREMLEIARHQVTLERTNEIIQETVEARTEQFRSAFQNAPIGMALVRADQSLLEVNSQLCAILGYPRHELLGQGLRELIPDPVSLVDGPELELRCRRRDGSYAWGLLKISSQPHLHEGMPYDILHLVDVTRRKQSEEALVQAHKLESIGILAGGIAHEINTPVQYVGDNLHFLQEAFTDLTRPDLPTDEAAYLQEEIPRAISQSLEGVERVATIVRSIKEYSHTGTDEFAPCDLHRVLESTITVARSEWKHVARVETHFDGELTEVTCNRGEMSQVFLNILVNAAHAMQDAEAEEEGVIQVATRDLGSEVAVSFTDSGRGIPPEVRARIFDPFFTTKPVGRGTGQGLAISHAVVTKHHGRIDVDSTVGGGSCFTVTLPKHPPLKEAC